MWVLYRWAQLLCTWNPTTGEVPGPKVGLFVILLHCHVVESSSKYSYLYIDLGCSQPSSEVEVEAVSEKLVKVLKVRGWMFSCKWGIYINATITKAQGPLWKKREKDCKCWRIGKCSVRYCLQYMRSLLQSWTKRSCAYLHRTYIRSSQSKCWHQRDKGAPGPVLYCRDIVNA